MTSNFSFGLMESASVREMQIERAIADWPEAYYEEIGRITGLGAARLKDVFLKVLAEDGTGYAFKFRQFERGHAVLQAKKGNHALILDARQPSRNAVQANSYLEVGLYGTNEEAVRLIATRLRADLGNFIRGGHEEVTWIFNDGGHIDDVIFPLKKYRDIMPEVYPFVSGDLDAWVDKFIASDSNILILNGPMGTGKSSLIAHIINRGKMSAMTAFDDKVMKNDSLYTNFISWSQNLLVLEDADLLLLGRVDKDNDTMSKLLNVSEGIIDTRGKKIIFTANLGNVKDIDSALLRPGRCFDIVEFRELTMAEANAARTKLGKRLFNNDKRTYSLAQVYQTE